MSYCNFKILVISIVLFFSYKLSAQKNFFVGDYEGLKTTLEKNQIESELRVVQYLNENNMDRWQSQTDGTVIYVADIGEDGKPIYLVTHNQGATFTTGANHFRNPDSGLLLDGSGVRMAIWDGGAVRNSHVEFQDRVLAVDGQSVNSHATHVMGTILAKGVVSTSVGMAPNAKAISYDFANDIQEMLIELSPERDILLLSNHSYGYPAGWNAGIWLGPVGESQDPRFGHYSGTSSTIDLFAYNAPYYLVVKSAGNQRSENPHYDIITDFGLSKNNLTVGAVQKIPSEYQVPSDIKMSSFSSWGPTDDGRIKPDIVAPGVGLFSPTAGSDDSYGTLSGTSMAAPSATGSLALIQQLYAQLNGGAFMKSSMLKALVLHTAHEAGFNPGPDYQFGWGLINTKGSVNVLANENGYSTLVKDYVLRNGEQIVIDFEVKGGKELKATIVWTDVPGSPVPIELNNRKPMLVNDLDLRVSNDDEVHYPWILDPERPAEPAQKQDNFRDNVEQVVFVPTVDNNYQLVVSHKGSLRNNEQTISLVLTFQSQIDDQSYYWLGGVNSDWNNPLNWSRTTKGTPDGTTPSKDNLIIIDENSNNDEIILSTDTQIKALKRLSKKPLNFNLNGNNLSLHAGLNNAFSGFKFFGEGKVIFKGEPGSEYILSPNESLKDVEILFDSPDVSWVFGSSTQFGKTSLLNGLFKISNKNISFEELTIASTIELILIDKSNIDIYHSLTIGGNDSLYQIENVSFNLVGDSTLLNSLVKLDKISIQNSAVFENEIFANRVQNFGNLLINKHLVTSSFITEKGTVINFAPDAVLEITNEFVSTGEPNNFIKYSANEGNGFVKMDGHFLVCLDYLNLENVNFQGAASVTAGLNSMINSSTGWFNVLCEDVLYADFSVSYLCQDGIPYFTNNSNGIIENYDWTLSNGQVFVNKTPYFTDTINTTFDVTLTVYSGEFQKSLTRTYDLLPNTLVKNTIVQSGDLLASLKSSDTFQWFRDFEIIENANQRTFNPENQAGNYFVLTFNEICNRKSSDFELIVLGLNETNHDILVYPNPTSEILNFKFENDYLGEIIVSFYDLGGKLMDQHTFDKTVKSFHEVISVNKLKGSIILNFTIQNKSYSKLIFINN